MDISSLTSLTGNFLKAENVKNAENGAWKISGESKIIENKFKIMRIHVPLTYGDNEFIFDCSKTNAKKISEELGNETKHWINNFLHLSIYKTRTSDGKMTDAINVEKAIKASEMNN